MVLLQQSKEHMTVGSIHFYTYLGMHWSTLFIQECPVNILVQYIDHFHTIYTGLLGQK